MGAVTVKENAGYTVKDILSLPEGERAELIDGVWYDMAAPTGTHQEILIAVAGELRNYIPFYQRKRLWYKTFQIPYCGSKRILGNKSGYKDC